MADKPPIVDQTPDLVNVILTFVDPAGKKWLAGGLLGPLEAEGDPATRILVSDLIDKPLAVTRFTVVRHDRN